MSEDKPNLGGEISDVSSPEPSTASTEEYQPQPSMSFLESIKSCFEKYFDFKSRAGRSEYWFFMLFGTLVGFAAQGLDYVIFDSEPQTGPLYLINFTILTIPQVSATTRRLHDVGRSGWWQLSYITIIGIFFVLYWTIQKGESSFNDYDKSAVT